MRWASAWISENRPVFKEDLDGLADLVLVQTADVTFCGSKGSSHSGCSSDRAVDFYTDDGKPLKTVEVNASIAAVARVCQSGSGAAFGAGRAIGLRDRPAVPVAPESRWPGTVLLGRAHAQNNNIARHAGTKRGNPSPLLLSFL